MLALLFFPRFPLMNVGLNHFMAPQVSYLLVYFVAAMIHTNTCHQNWLAFARPMTATEPAKQRCGLLLKVP